MPEYRENIKKNIPPVSLHDKGAASALENSTHTFRMPEPPAFKDVVRIVEKVNLPIVEISTLFDLIGRENVVKGFRAQGETKFIETLSIFKKVGIGKCIHYIALLNDPRAIGQKHISKDFTRGPYSLATIIAYLDNKEIYIQDLYRIVPRLKNAVGERSFEKGFPSWSLHFFFQTIQKIKAIGVDDFFSIISMLQDIFGQGHIGGAYEQGYLWFVEAIDIFSTIGTVESNRLIKEFQRRSNIHYFNTAFAHNPRSFARYIKLKSESLDKEVRFVIAQKNITSSEIITLFHDLLEKYFAEDSYLNLAPSELTAFVFDAVMKYLEGESNETTADYLRKKYFSDFSKRNVYSLLREIGPEIEIQKGLQTYDVDTAHMVAFFLLVETSGDALIEFPLGPARYHGSLSELVRAMKKVSIGQEFLIPQDKIIPLDVSISIPPQIIEKTEFQEKATLLRVVNDLLFTATVRFATAFQACPQDQSGIRFKKGLAKVTGSKKIDLAENRSGNMITNPSENSIANPLTAHEASFEFYQMMYSALVAAFMPKPDKNDFQRQLTLIYHSFEKQVLSILNEEKIAYIAKIDSNYNFAFLELSHVRSAIPQITVRLEEVVKQHLILIHQEVLKEAIKRRMEQLENDNRDVESEIKTEIQKQKEIDPNYAGSLEEAFLTLTRTHPVMEDRDMSKSVVLNSESLCPL